MDEPDLHRLGLPEPAAAPAFSPSSDGLDAALRRARHRRANRSLGLALAVLALPAAGVLLVPGDSTDDSLRLARTPATTPQPPAPRGTARPDPVRPTGAAALPGASPAAVSVGAPVGPPATGAGPDDPREPAPTPRRDERPAYVERPREVPGHDCGNVEDAATGFHVGGGPCIRGTGPYTLRRGESATFVLSMCQYALSDDTLVLGFRTGQEHELTVRDRVDDEDGFATDAGTRRWTWSAGLRFPQGLHQRALPPDRCLEWTTTWDGRDQSGRLLPAGEYVVEQRLTDSSGFGRVPTGQGITLVD